MKNTDRACKKCGEYIPYLVKIDGKSHNLKNRKFCLSCSPFKQHNTRDLTQPKPRRSQKFSDYRRRKKMKLVEYKGGQCKRCGYNRRIPDVYHFHHLDESKKEFQISGSYRRSWDDLYKEVDKCDLLCSNCHAEVHWEQNIKLGKAKLV
jgi:hypothetical protein